MRDFKKLKILERGHKFTLKIYKITSLFPQEERYGVTSQLRRAAASIPTNIAEGCGKHTEKDFARYISIAAGSTSEAEYLLILSKDLKYLDDSLSNEMINEITEIKKMLNVLLIKIYTS
ncbi:MAG: four helix bundle protein [Melioribacteraceae bacterium]|nr:four helix bundle protein [Melioribacteraceae bacterium]